MKNFRKIILWILVGLLSLGQLQRIELSQFNSAVSIYFHDILIIFIIFHVLFTNFKDIKLTVINYLKKEKKVLLFLFLLLFSHLLNIISGDYISLLYSLRLFLYITFGISLSILIKNNKYDAEYFKFQLFSVGVISLFLGFLQYIFIKDTRFLSIFGWDDHYARLISTFFDPGFTGIIFLLTVLIGLSCKYIQNNTVKIITVAVFIWGIILTFSRASYLALIVSLLLLTTSYLKITTDSAKKIVIGLLFIAFLILLAPKPYGEGVNLLRTSTITARIAAISKQLTSLSPKTLILGNGLFSEKNSLNYQLNEKNQLIPSHSRMPDNLFINVLLSTGIFGLLLFVSLLYDWAKRIRLKNSYIYAGFIALLVHSQFSNSLLQPFILLLLLGGIATLTTPKKIK